MKNYKTIVEMKWWFAASDRQRVDRYPESAHVAAEIVCIDIQLSTRFLYVRCDVAGI